MMIVLLIAAYIVCATLNAGAVYAWLCEGSTEKSDRRLHLAFAWGFTIMLPVVSWFAAFFITAFYEAGWRRPWTTNFEGDQK